MAWYNAGTVSVTQNSATITGAGTAWPDYVDAGQAFVGPDGLSYEILAIISATQLTLASNYRGATASGQAYRIMPVQGYLRDLAIQANQLVQSFATVRDTAGQGIFQAGTAAAPALRFSGDEDTGIYRAGANTLGFATGGLDRMRIDSGGNLSVGQASAAVNSLRYLDVYNSDTGASSGAILRLITQNAGNTGLTTLDIVKYKSGGVVIQNSEPNSAGYLALGTASAQRLRIQANGYVSIGPPLAGDASAPLDVQTGAGRLLFTSNGGSHTVTGVNLANNAFQHLQLNGASLQAYVGGQYRAAFIDNAFYPNPDAWMTLGIPSLRWNTIYAATGSINTSDERTKQDVGAIPHEWLDAWGDLEWARYRFRDAEQVKGTAARWHVGLIAQHVRDAFVERGLDATEIGLLCYDEWGEEREPIMEERQIDIEIVITEKIDTGLFDAEGNPVFRDVTEERPVMGMVDTGETRVTLEAGNRWGLRYDECQAMEAVWQRRELARKDALIADLSNRLAAIEGVAS